MLPISETLMTSRKNPQSFLRLGQPRVSDRPNLRVTSQLCLFATFDDYDNLLMNPDCLPWLLRRRGTIVKICVQSFFPGHQAVCLRHK